MNRFGSYLRELRQARRLSLKKVEKAARVSNAYLSQIERGLRNPPHPDILNRLAKIYGVPARDLLIAAGYLKEEHGVTPEEIERAYGHVLSDPQYRQGTRLKGQPLTLDAKRFIVEMYEKATGRKLLRES